MIDRLKVEEGRGKNPVVIISGGVGGSRGEARGGRNGGREGVARAPHERRGRGDLPFSCLALVRCSQNLALVDHCMIGASPVVLSKNELHIAF